MSNVRKLKSGSYHYRKQIDGKRICITFDHKPTEKEIQKALAKEISELGERVPKNAFGKCCKDYIEVKRPVLSPSTIKGYVAQINAISDDLKKMDINQITQVDIQREISDHSKTHSAKSTSNFHGFISAVLGMYRPSLHLSTTLPQKVKFEAYTPSENDIKRILEAAKATKWSILFQLGILGMRRSEVCALSLEDLDGNKLHISKAKVQNEKGVWLVKNLTKTTEGKRTIYLPDSLVAEVQKNGLYDGDPGTILKHLHKYQDKLGIPRFRYHDLRAFYASYAHSKGISDATIMETGGWQSDAVMKKIYRRALEEDKKKPVDAMNIFF